ncbi:hypothetical protein [uncultured Methylobacterium sp.]|uniref:hypothetical protein n=1 Tax=uncultured Methylobacterium sp. TaxID=157278 RepID=UPI0035CC2319
MGKPRTPKGRTGRDGTPPHEPSAAVLDAAAVLRAELGRDGPAQEPLHAHLLDTVSPGTLGGRAPVEAPGTAPIPADANLSIPVDARGKVPPTRVDTNVVTLTVPVAPPQRAAASEPEEAPPVLAAPSGPAPASWRAGARRPEASLKQALAGMGGTLFAYVRGEGAATVSHLQALKDVRSPADAIRLQVGEIQRAADASLTCWSELARRAVRVVAPR